MSFRFRRRAKFDINEPMEQHYAAKTMARHWPNEINEYRKPEMQLWRSAYH